jgi:hypothetical protein
MNAYKLPDPRFYITGEYNPNFFEGYEESLYNQDNTGGSTFDLSGLNLDETYVRRDGARSMTQPITSPGFYLVGEDSKIAFHEGEQYKPFTNAIYDQHNTNTYKTAGLLYDVSTNLYTVDSIAIRRILFKDNDENIFIQQQAFTDQDKTDIVNLKQKTTLMTSDSNLNKTTIPILHADTFTTSLYNTNYLVNISSDVQLQLDTLKNKTSQITNNGTITTVNGQISTNIINLFGDGVSGRQLKFFEPSGTTTQISAFTEQHRSAILDMSLNIIDISQNMKTVMDTLRNDLSLNLLDVSSNQSQINDLLNRTRQMTYDNGITDISGIVNLDKIIFNYHEQVDAFTTAHRSKVEWLDINQNRLLVNKLMFTGTAEEQTRPYTEERNTLLNTVDGRTKYTTAYQVTGQPPATVISGHLDTNFITLWDGFGFSGYIRYPDGTQQQSAFTNTLKTNVENMKYNTRNVIYYDDGFDTTQIGGRIVTNNLRLYNGNLGFSDGTIQTTAYVPPIKFYQYFTFNARIILSFDTAFQNNAEYEGLRESSLFASMVDEKWHDTGHINQHHSIIKPGRYLVQVKMEFTALKWYRRALFYLRWEKQDVGLLYNTKKTGVILDSSSTNESKLFIDHNHVFEVPDTAGYTFKLCTDYWFATALTGTTTIDGSFVVTEL